MAGDAAQRAAQGADDAGRDRRFKAERAADGHDELADAQRGRIAQLGVRQRSRLGLNHGKIGPRVGADDAAGDFLAVAEADAHALVSLDDVMIGQQEAVGREQDAGAGAFPPTAAARRLTTAGRSRSATSTTTLE